MTSTAPRKDSASGSLRPDNPFMPKRQNFLSALSGELPSDFPRHPFDEPYDDHYFQINTLYYSDMVPDSETPFTDAMKRNLWVQESYAEVFQIFG